MPRGKAGVYTHTKKLNIRTEPELLDRISKAAEAKGWGKSWMIRKFIKEGLRRHGF